MTMLNKTFTFSDIESNLAELETTIRKAMLISDEIVTDYFEKYNPDNADDRLLIAYGFDVYRIKSDIVYDELIVIKKNIEAIQSIFKVDPDAAA